MIFFQVVVVLIKLKMCSKLKILYSKQYCNDKPEQIVSTSEAVEWGISDLHFEVFKAFSLLNHCIQTH